MLMVEIKTVDIDFSKDMQNKFGKAMGASICKKSECTLCGGIITWYMYSGNECPHCKGVIPHISDIMDSLEARLLYYQCTEINELNKKLGRLWKDR